MAKRMGFEGVLKWGVAGSTASTSLLIARDFSYKFENTEADVSDRSSIIALMDVGQVKFSIEFEVNNDNSNAFISALRIAAATGAAMALATEDFATGWGVDGDFIVSDDEGIPLADAQRLKITASPTDKNTRVPVWA